MDGPRCLLHVINIQTMWRAYRENTCVCVCVLCVTRPWLFVCVCVWACLKMCIGPCFLREISLSKFSLTSANQGHSGG